MYSYIILLIKLGRLAWHKGSDPSPSVQLIEERVSDNGDATRDERCNCSLEPVHVVDNDVFNHRIENRVDITTTYDARQFRLKNI